LTTILLFPWATYSLLSSSPPDIKVSEGVEKGNGPNCVFVLDLNIMMSAEGALVAVKHKEELSDGDIVARERMERVGWWPRSD
jgi:hypothetical protein